MKGLSGIISVFKEAGKNGLPMPIMLFNIDPGTRTILQQAYDVGRQIFEKIRLEKMFGNKK